MVEKLLSLDTKLFVFLNGLGSETYDGLWLFITKQSNWIPLFLLLLYVIYKKLGAKQTLYLLLFVAVLVTFTDQTTNLFNDYALVIILKSIPLYELFKSETLLVFSLDMQQIQWQLRHFCFLVLKTKSNFSASYSCGRSSLHTVESIWDYTTR